MADNLAYKHRLAEKIYQNKRNNTKHCSTYNFTVGNLAKEAERLDKKNLVEAGYLQTSYKSKEEDDK